MKNSDVLKKALAKINKGWTRGVSSRNKNGTYVEPSSRKAVRFCALGAVWAITPSAGRIADKAIFILSDAIGTKSIVAWNDAPGRTKKQVIAVFEKAIKLAEKSEKK